MNPEGVRLDNIFHNFEPFKRRYIEFFCGNGPDCQLPQLARDDDVYKSKMVEIAKKRMLDDYFVVGVLEQFEDSLSVFEKLLPRYYRGALEVYESKSRKPFNQTCVIKF